MSCTIFVIWRAVLGLQATSKTVENLHRTADDRLAKTTGTIVVPPDKLTSGFPYAKSKFDVAGVTDVRSETVEPPRVLECPSN